MLSDQALMIGTSFSGYQILSRIGGGNTGIVYKAYDPQMEREVALKILPDNLLINKEKRSRFMRETRAAHLLSHHAIAKLHETGEFENHYFLAMEYVDGDSYTHIFENYPEGAGLGHFFELILPLLEGTAYAHDQNLAHRDLKPDNLKMTRDGQPKILDFGLVKFLDQKGRTSDESFQTMAGMVVGSAGYMSPEQAKGGVFDERTDVFSLGIIMYELLSGRNPFQGASPFATISKILHFNPLSLELLRPDLPLDLCRIVIQCLSKDMVHRFENGQSLFNAVQSIKG